MQITSISRQSADTPRARATSGWIGRWWCLRHTRRQLLALDPAQLRDVGLTRFDAVREARRPFWDARTRSPG